MRRKWTLLLLAVCMLCILHLSQRERECGKYRWVNRLTDADNQRRTSFESNCGESLIKLHRISCERIVKGDTEYIKTLSSLSLHRPINTCNEVYSQNCHSIVNRYKRPVSDEELDFPLAFTLKVHKDPVQVEQLLRAIYRPHNVYCIHVDSKAEESVVKTLQHVASCFPNVFVLQKINVVYGSIGLLMSDIVCMEELIASKVKWKYYLNLAGQEYPIKTNLEIVQIIKLLNGRNDIESYPFPKGLNWRFEIKHVIVNNKLVKSNVTKSSFKHNIPFFKGSMYGMFTRNFVEFILDSHISRNLISWANETFAPEELVWATLNSLPGTPGGYNVTVSHGKKQFLSRAMLWKWDKTKCNGKFVHSVCIFNYKDIPWLASSPEIVANKFYSEYDQLTIDCLEEWLHNKTLTGSSYNLNWNYYRNVPHVKMNF